MAGGVEAGDAMDDAGERRALVLLDEARQSLTYFSLL